MFKEEEYIGKCFGKDNSFKVPDGYFDAVTQKVMGRIATDYVPQGKCVQDGVPDDFAGGKTATLSFWTRYRRAIVGVAASVCICMLPLGAYFHHVGNVADVSVAVNDQAVDTDAHAASNIDAFMEYSMMDTDDMYSYIADAR